MPFTTDAVEPLAKPRLRLLVWLGDMGSVSSDEVRHKLLNALAASTLPAVAGSLNSSFVAVLAYSRMGHPSLLLIALIDILTLMLRLCVTNLGLFRTFGTDIVMLSGLVWAACVGMATAVIGFGDDTTVFAVAVASAFGCCAGIMSRNYVVPRLALAQVVLIDLGFKLSFVFKHPEFLPILVVQGVGFIVLIRWMMRQQLKMSVQALTAELESRMQSRVDPLTGLLNRRGLHQAVPELLVRRGPMALFYIDLDGFKQVNDKLGHATGDELLRQVGRRLSISHPTAAICRIGGDEFLALVSVQEPAEAHDIAGRMIHTISLPYKMDSLTAHVSASIGITFMSIDKPDLAKAMSEADEALYEAKGAGRGRAILYGAIAAMRASA